MTTLGELVRDHRSLGNRCIPPLYDATGGAQAAIDALGYRTTFSFDAPLANGVRSAPSRSGPRSTMPRDGLTALDAIRKSNPHMVMMSRDVGRD